MSRPRWVLDQKNIASLCLKQFSLPEFIEREIIRLSFTADEICILTFERILPFIQQYQPKEYITWLDDFLRNPYITFNFQHKCGEIMKEYWIGFMHNYFCDSYGFLDYVRINSHWTDEIAMNDDYHFRYHTLNPAISPEYKNTIPPSDSKSMMIFMDKHPECSEHWDWCCLSLDYNFPIDFIKRYIKKESDWTFIFKSIYITLDLIEANPDIPWDWFDISEHPCITPGIIEANLNLPWDWIAIARNPNITIDFVMRHLDRFSLSAENISINRAISMKDILAHPEFPWNWGCVELNPNLTIDFMVHHFPIRMNNYDFAVKTIFTHIASDLKLKLGRSFLL
jgi:hypothetical protein